MAKKVAASTKKKISEFAKTRPRNANGQFVGLGRGMNITPSPKRSSRTFGRS